MANSAFLLLGSNEGNREKWLERGVALLSERCGVVVRCSDYYSTAAWGKIDQPDFLNQAVRLETDLPPLALLQHIQSIEQYLGRQREVKWGQRTLDIDIIFYGNEIIDLPQLKVPHPYLPQRRFALVPIAAIAGENFVHPLLGDTLTQLLAECPDTLPVSLYTPED